MRGLPTRRLRRLRRTARRASGLAPACWTQYLDRQHLLQPDLGEWAAGRRDSRALPPMPNSVWIGSASGGLYRFENNQLQVLTQENVGLPSNRILALLVAPDRSLYVGTDAGMVRFARAANSIRCQACRPMPSHHSPWAQMARFLPELARKAHGCCRPGSTSATPWVALQSDSGVLPASLRALAIDLYSGAWLGTDGSGLMRQSLAPAAE